MGETNMSQRRSLVSPCLALIISTSFVTTSLVATTPKVTYAGYEKVLAMFWKKYLPVYPVEAIRKRIQGGGVFRMYIDENGVVTKVGVMKSTGHEILDVRAAAGLSRWGAKPGRRREVDVPVQFAASI
jgi:TonB family protein